MLAEEYTFGFPGGMTDSAVATAFPPTHCQYAFNFRIAQDGMLQVRSGSKRLHTSALNSGALVYGATMYRTAGGTVQWIVFAGAKAYKSTDEGVNWTEIASGLRTDYWSLCTFTSAAGTTYLCCANGGTNSYSWDGTTWAAISNIPNGVKYLATYNDRLYAAGHHVINVVASKIGDFSTWAVPDGLLLRIQAHDGDGEFRGLFTWRNNLFVFKRESTAYVDGYGNATIIVATGPRGVSRSVGCIAHRSICAVGESELVWLSERGLESFAGGEVRLLSDPLRLFVAGIGWGTILADGGVPCSVYDRQLHEYRLALPAGAERNTIELVFNTQTRGLTLFGWATDDPLTGTLDSDGYMVLDTGAGFGLGVDYNSYLLLLSGGAVGLSGSIDSDGYLSLALVDYAPASYMTGDFAGVAMSAPISGGYDGFVRQLEVGETDDQTAAGVAGSAITALMVSRPFLFGAPFHRKNGRSVEVLAVTGNSADVTVSLLGDGVEGPQHTLTLAASAGNTPSTRTALSTARGRTLNVVVRSSAAGLKLAGVRLGARVFREFP